MTRARSLVIPFFVALVGALGAWGWTQSQDEFDHLRHQRMFPSCDGCHQIEQGRVTFPEPALCAQCHNGEIVRRVEWAGPSAPPSNLDFDHVEVLQAKREALGFEMPCATCHAPQGGERMDVRRVALEGCLGCHASGQDHMVDAECSTCHVPLAESRDYSVAQLRELPIPADHDADFIWEHGAQAQGGVDRCSVCHARELCSSCHVNAPSVESIQALPSDRRVAAIAAEGKVEYPTPASHTARDWLETHGATARGGVADCAACHTRTSCQTCHGAPGPDPVSELPRAEGSRTQGRGPGVTLTRRPPASHTPTFLEDHRAFAASATLQCEMCHTRNQCTSCHTGSGALSRPGRDVARYHPENFLQQHSAAAFSQQVECATCHNPEAFCRSCHTGQGLAAGAGRFDRGFHNEDPAWVFGHGQAARQNLESCASCHAQRDCLVCHSAVSGRRISPHGPDFDADRLRDKNPELCLRCHLRSILEP